MRAIGQNICYSGVNCALGATKSIRYGGDFVIVGFVTVGFVSTYFTVILLGFQNYVIAGFIIAGSHCIQTKSAALPRVTKSPG